MRHKIASLFFLLLGGIVFFSCNKQGKDNPLTTEPNPYESLNSEQKASVDALVGKKWLVKDAINLFGGQSGKAKATAQASQADPDADFCKNDDYIVFTKDMYVTFSPGEMICSEQDRESVFPYTISDDGRAIDLQMTAGISIRWVFSNIEQIRQGTADRLEIRDQTNQNDIMAEEIPLEKRKLERVVNKQWDNSIQEGSVSVQPDGSIQKVQHAVMRTGDYTYSLTGDLQQLRSRVDVYLSRNNMESVPYHYFEFTKFDAAGRITSEGVEDGSSIAYSYDENGRLSSALTGIDPQSGKHYVIPIRVPYEFISNTKNDLIDGLFMGVITSCKMKLSRDAQGRIIRTDFYDERDLVTTALSYEYGSEVTEKLIRCRYINNGTFEQPVWEKDRESYVQKNVFRFDGNNRLVEKSSYNITGEGESLQEDLLRKEVYSYDLNSNLIKREVYGLSGVLETVYRYYYFGNDKPFQILTTYPSVGEVVEQTISYDGYGNCTSVRVSSNEQMMRYEEYENTYL